MTLQQDINRLKPYFLSKDGGAMQGDINPAETDTYDLGNADKRWANIHAGTVYADNLTVSGGGSGVAADTVDGFDASLTPTPSTILPLDVSGVFPTSVIPDALLKDGSRALEGSLSVVGGATIDGIDLGSHNHDGTAGMGVQLSHATLTGLLADDHTQYYNVTRHTLAVHTGLGLVPNTITITAGAGLSGGGDLSANRTINITTSAGSGITIGTDDIIIDQTAGFNPTWLGAHTFNDTVAINADLSSHHHTPVTADAYDLGSETVMWRKGWLSELQAILFSLNTVTLLGGWLAIYKNAGKITNAIDATQTTVDFGTAMTPGDFVVFRAPLKLEYMEVGTLVSGDVYNVTRGIERGAGIGTGEAWAAEAPFAVLGQSGDGRIELNAYDSPKIQVKLQGATYDIQDEIIRMGDLNGWGGYSAQEFGFGVGLYTSGQPNITIDPTNGLRIRSYTTDIITLDTSGNATIQNTNLLLSGTSSISIGTVPPTGPSTGTGLWIDEDGLFFISSSTPVMEVTSTGNLNTLYDPTETSYALHIGDVGVKFTATVNNYGSAGIFWNSEADYRIGAIYSNWDRTTFIDGVISLNAMHEASSPWSKSRLVLTAYDTENGLGAGMTLISGIPSTDLSTIYFTAETMFWIDSDVHAHKLDGFHGVTFAFGDGLNAISDNTYNTARVPYKLTGVDWQLISNVTASVTVLFQYWTGSAWSTLITVNAGTATSGTYTGTLDKDTLVRTIVTSAGAGLLLNCSFNLTYRKEP